MELTRGKYGRLVGDLTGLLTTLKALPSAYDKDLQEDKPLVFDAFDTLQMILPTLAGLIRSLRLRPETMLRRLDPSIFATDLADYLVMKGIPFRQAHSAVSRVVHLAEKLRTSLDRLPLEILKGVSPYFEDDVPTVFDLSRALARRSTYGGTAPDALEVQLKAAEPALAQSPPGPDPGLRPR